MVEWRSHRKAKGHYGNRAVIIGNVPATKHLLEGAKMYKRYVIREEILVMVENMRAMVVVRECYMPWKR